MSKKNAPFFSCQVQTERVLPFCILSSERVLTSAKIARTLQ
jgi:hypothetical protein